MAQMPTMSAPNSVALSLRCRAAAAGDPNAVRSTASGPVKRGSCSSRMRRRNSSTSGMAIVRPPAAAYHDSQSKADGSATSRLHGGAGLAGIAVLDHQLRALPVTVPIVWRPGAQSVHVAVVHAEGRGDQHGVVNLRVVGARIPGSHNVVVA